MKQRKYNRLAIATFGLLSTVALGQTTSLNSLILKNEPAKIVADLDANGTDDWIEIHQQAQTVLIYHQQTSTNWGIAQQINLTLAGPYLCALGDVDNDGSQDLAISYYQSSVVGIFHGLAGGLFETTPTYIHTQPGPTRIFALPNLSTASSTDSIQVWHPDLFIFTRMTHAGARTYTPTQHTLPLANTAQGPSDFDLATASSNTNASPKITLIEPNGTSTSMKGYATTNSPSFQISHRKTLGVIPRQHIRFAKLHSGFESAVYITGLGTAFQTYSFNDNGATWAGTGGNHAFPEAPSWVQAHDLTGDTIADLISINLDRSKVHLLINNGNATFQPPQLLMTGIPGSYDQLLLGEFTGSIGASDIIARNSSNLFQLYENNGTGSFTQTPATRDPFNPSPSTSLASSSANVLLTNGKDPSDDDFESYGALRVNDWTDNAGSTTGGIVAVSSYRNLSNVLVYQGTNNISLPAAQQGSNYFTLVNQVDTNRSYFFITQATPPKTHWVKVFPAGGTYRGALQLNFDSDITNIFYKLGDAPFQAYTTNTTLLISESTLLRFYASDLAGSSSLHVENYIITPDNNGDRDRDHIPDDIEALLGFDPYTANGDSDGDGWSDLEETLRNTDPLDPNSNPLNLANDSDGDGWSDLDEQWRGTSPADPNDFPTAENLYTPEILLSGTLYKDMTNTVLGAAALTVSPTALSAVQDSDDPSYLLQQVDQLAYDGTLLILSAFLDHSVTIFDASNPTSLLHRATMTDGINGFDELAFPFGVVIEGNLLAIAANSDDAVTLVDISVPTNPVELAVLKDGLGGFDFLNGAISLAIQSNILAVVASSDNAVTLVDISNPATPLILSVIRPGINGVPGATTGFSKAVFTDNNLLIISANLSHSINIFDISTPTSPLHLAERKDGVGGYNDLNTANGLAVEGNLLAVSALGDDALSLIDISTPTNPVLLSVIKDGLNGFNGIKAPRTPDFLGNVLAVSGSGENTVNLIDVSNPSTPLLLTEMRDDLDGTIWGGPKGVQFAGEKLAVVGRGKKGATLIDINLSSSGGAKGQLLGLQSAASDRSFSAPIAGLYNVRLSGHQDYTLKAQPLLDDKTCIARYIQDAPYSEIHLTNSYTNINDFITDYLAAYTNQLIIQRTGQDANPLTTASLLLLERFANIHLLPTTTNYNPLLLNGANLTATNTAFLHQNYDFDNLPTYFESQILSTPLYQTNLLNIITGTIHYACTSTGLTADTCTTLGTSMIPGATPQTENLPATANTLTLPLFRSAVSQLLASVTSTLTNLSGSITVQPNGNILLTQLAQNYQLLGPITLGLSSGLDINATGHLLNSATGNPILIDLISYTINQFPPLTTCDDTDNDNLCDEWEYYWFGNLLQFGWSDPDNDGFSNLHEQNAHTHPGSSSLLPTEPITYILPYLTAQNQPTNTTMTIHFDGYAGQVYQLQSNDNLQNPLGWQDLPGIQVNGSNLLQTVTFPLPTNGQRQYYRMRVLP